MQRSLATVAGTLSDGWSSRQVVERVPLAHDGKSGSSLERVTTADGRVWVVKIEDPRDNWVLQTTGDNGRLFRLWSSGELRRLPAGIDCAIESVEELPSGWRVVMRDVSALLVPPGRMLTRDESRRIVAAMASLHDAYVGTRIDGLCPLVDRYAFFTPAAVRSVATHPMAPFALPGWERLVELAPEDIAPTLLRLLDRPGMLAAALSGYPSTLVHGDLKIANLGFDDRRIVMLDWGSLTGYAPRAVDYAWYLAINGAAIDASLDEQLSDVLAVLTPEDQHALPLALLGVLLQLGWDKGLAATSEDLAVRERELADLRWWWARVREALEQWSPR